MTVPPWPARRVGGRILCGRKVDGLYVCQGELGDIRGGAPFPSIGMTEDPPGFWRPTKRSRRRGPPTPLRPVASYGALPPIKLWAAPDLPWQRKCPHCNVVAIVTGDVLSSEADR